MISALHATAVQNKTIQLASYKEIVFPHMKKRKKEYQSDCCMLKQGTPPWYRKQNNYKVGSFAGAENMQFSLSWTNPFDNNNAVLSLSVILNHIDMWNQKTDWRGRCVLYIVSIAGSEEAGRPGRQISGVWRVHRLVRRHSIHRFWTPGECCHPTC